MEWWQWVAWSVALLSGLGGLILGIRAERRARYRPLWTPEIERQSSLFHNRTGEDAINVRLDVGDGWRLTNYRPYSAVASDEAARFATVPTPLDSKAPFSAVLRWVRASSGREYRVRIGDASRAREIDKRLRASRRRK